MHVHLNAGFLGFVHDRLQHFDLRLRRRRFGNEPDLTGVLDALRGQRLDRRARFGRGLVMPTCPTESAAAVGFSGLDEVAERDVVIGLPPPMSTVV